LVDDQVKTKILNKEVNKQLPEFHFPNTQFFVDIIDKFIKIYYRSSCYVAGGVFTKYNSKYKTLYPTAFEYFSKKQDIDIFVLEDSAGVLSVSHSEILEEYDNRYDDWQPDKATLNNSIYKTVKLKYDQYIVNIILLDSSIKTITQALENFDFYFCKIYFEYSTKRTFAHYDNYKNYLYIDNKEREKFSLKPYIASYNDLNDDDVVKAIWNSHICCSQEKCEFILQKRVIKYILKDCIPIKYQMNDLIKTFEKNIINHIIE
jgi:hypothetical protein